jgi:hypothetical protein
MRREYGLHPWDAYELPVAVFVRYVAALSPGSVTVQLIAAQRPHHRTVQVETPADEAEHRRRLTTFRGLQ